MRRGSEVVRPLAPTLESMDRFSYNSLRVAPRRAGPRRARRRSARAVPVGDQRQRSLWLLGALATLLLLPTLLHAQGLRSQVAWVTLSATKRAESDSSSAQRTVRGPSVSDIEIPSPRGAATFDSSSAAELRVEEDGVRGASLWVRDSDNRLIPLSARWTRVPLSSWLRFRAVAAGGSSLGAARWQLRYRRVLTDGTPVGQQGTIVTVSTGAAAGR